MSRQSTTASFRRRSAAYSEHRQQEKELPPLPLPSPYDNCNDAPGPQFTNMFCASPVDMDNIPLTPHIEARDGPTRMSTLDTVTYNHLRRDTRASSSTASSITLRNPSDVDSYSHRQRSSSTASRGSSITAIRPSIASSMLTWRAFSNHPAHSRGDDKSPSRNGTIDSSRSTLVDTTDRFTQRWPVPGLNTVSKAKKKRRGRFEEGLGMEDLREWPKMKWCLLVSVLTVMAYASFAMFFSLSTWFRTWDHADVMYVADYDLLVLISFAGSILLLTSIVGFTGVMLNSRPTLAVYNLLLWPSLISMLAIGYTSYKRSAYALDHKLSFFWSQYFTPLGRLLIQNSLHCCGFYSPLHTAVPSRRCHPRTGLPGCKGKLCRFERYHLESIWTVTFSLVAVHLLNIAVALLCSNHVTETFGKGIIPRQYRLTNGDVKADEEKLKLAMKRPEYSRASTSLTFREDRKWTNDEK